MKFYNKNRVDVIAVFWLQCYPGTEIKDIVKKRSKENEKELKSNAGMLRNKGKYHQFCGLKKFLPLFYFTCLIPKWCVRLIIRTRAYSLMPNFGAGHIATGLIRKKYEIKYLLGLKKKPIRFINRRAFYLYYIAYKLFNKLKNINYKQFKL